MNVAVPPAPGTIFPSAAGVTLHVNDAGTAFPYASVAAAVNRRVPRTGTVPATGVTATTLGAAGATVTVCVPLDAPAADAVSVWLPATVSR